jgi:peptidoglycan hydrolase CwlO-like protein
MTITNQPARRLLTIVGVVAAIAVGFTAVQAAAAWTAEAAPLTAKPVSAAAIEARLLDEQTRSADLQRRLTTLSGDTQALATALEAAQARIDAGTAHATELERDLATAKRKLAALQRSIRQAARATTTTTTASSSRSSGGDDDEEGHGDDDD